MLQWVKNIAEFSDDTYGKRRIQKALNALEFPVGRRKTVLGWKVIISMVRSSSDGKTKLGKITKMVITNSELYSFMEQGLSLNIRLNEQMH